MLRAILAKLQVTPCLLSTWGPLSIPHPEDILFWLTGPFWGLFGNPPELEGPNFRLEHAYTHAIYGAVLSKYGLHDEAEALIRELSGIL